MFNQRASVCYNTFKFICKRLGSYLQRKNTQMRETNSVESRIATSLQRLGIVNTLCTVGEVYIWGGRKYNFIIVQIFCRSVRVHLQRTFVQFSSPARFRVLVQEFEALHGIPRIIGAIDGSHIPILAHVI